MPELSERGESAQQRVSPPSWRDLQGRGRGPAGGAPSAAGEGPGEPAGAGQAGGEAGGPRQECLGRGVDGEQQAGAGAVRLALVRDSQDPSFLYTLSAEDKGPTVSSKHRDQVSSVQAATLPRTLRQAHHQQNSDGTILLQLHTATPARQAGGWFYLYISRCL